MTHVEKLVRRFAEWGLKATSYSEPDSQVDGSINFGPIVHIQVEAHGWLGVCSAAYDKDGELQSITHHYIGDSFEAAVRNVKKALAKLN